MHSVLSSDLDIASQLSVRLSQAMAQHSITTEPAAGLALFKSVMPCYTVNQGLALIKSTPSHDTKCPNATLSQCDDVTVANVATMHSVHPASGTPRHPCGRYPEAPGGSYEELSQAHSLGAFSLSLPAPGLQDFSTRDQGVPCHWGEDVACHACVCGALCPESHQPCRVPSPPHCAAWRCPGHPSDTPAWCQRCRR